MLTVKEDMLIMPAKQTIRICATIINIAVNERHPHVHQLQNSTFVTKSLKANIC
jgi:hypothetical protein